MASAFEIWVNTELPKRLAIATAVANSYTRFTGTGKQVEARTVAQVLADISGAKMTTGAGAPGGAGAEGDFYWDTAGDALYVNDDGATSWTQIGAGGGSAHVIEEDGAPLTARANLNFAAGLVASDNAPDTDVDADYATTEIADIASTEAAGSSDKLPRADHVHKHPAAGLGSDDHHAESHTVASHSDTTATGAETETLTDGSDADALHDHGNHGVTHNDVHGISKHTGHANWKALYSDGSGDEQELALGADGTFLQSGGPATLPEFTALVVADIPYDDGTSDPLATGAAASDGTENSPARKDHVHPYGTQYSVHTYVFVPDAAFDADVETGDQQGIVHHSADNNETVIAWGIDCETAPTGAAIKVQLEFGNTDDLDTVASWTEIDIDDLPVTTKSIKFLVGVVTNSTITANRLIRMNVDQVGSTIAGQNASVWLMVKRPLVT